MSTGHLGRLALAAFIFVAGWLFLRSAVQSSSASLGLNGAPLWILELMAVGLAGALLASVWFFSMVRDLLAALRDPGRPTVRGLLVEQLAATAILAISFLLLGVCAWHVPP